MKNVFKVAPVLALIFSLSACGGGGGTATPDDLARNVVKAITSENFDSLYGMQPLHLIDADYDKDVRDYRIKEGYDKWKYEKDRILGNKEKNIEAEDPEEKSGVKDEDSWKAASPERMYALDAGCYKLYKIKKFEDRVTNAKFYNTGANIGQRTEDGVQWDHKVAEVRFVNIYGDSIRVRCRESNGVWYLSSVSLRFPEELPKPRED